MSIERFDSEDYQVASAPPRIITIFAAHGDGGERGTGPVVGYYSTLEAAKARAYHAGWYGGDGGTSVAKAIEVGGEMFVLLSDKPIDLDDKKSDADKRLREETLNSLSAEQRRVLGLK
jgi:hypothetical protein